MNLPDPNFVYHGSPERFETVTPKRNIRSKLHKNGEREVIFDDISFHATPYKWIALAYTLNRKRAYENGEKKVEYNMGVSLYDHDEELTIYGAESLEASLEKLYGAGGYLLTFERAKFYHTVGLGNLELITKENLKPLKIEYITDPVAELRKLGIKFKFVNLAEQENRNMLN